MGTNIVPVIKDDWKLPELDTPNPYYSNQRIGRMYADLAPSTPPQYVSALSSVADRKLNEAYGRSLEHYERFGEKGLEQTIHDELARAAEYVRIRVVRDEALSHAH